MEDWPLGEVKTLLLRIAEVCLSDRAGVLAVVAGLLLREVSGVFRLVLGDYKRGRPAVVGQCQYALTTPVDQIVAYLVSDD